MLKNASMLLVLKMLAGYLLMGKEYNNVPGTIASKTKI
jgi:hypothetical protein